ncbi:DNA-binding protein [Bradyrhizobium sp. NC92]|uniref:DNA-binding protein n=1 Tax=Bradyrhizobium sp. (strain NC92) TaxID=55395 RepID=UPI0021AB00B5|nr:DNA-binding protein [Bradyrhizobium sp. NC92]UWU65669.1 DNA-binding protein [Bradyrhizobium sp. NC92]
MRSIKQPGPPPPERIQWVEARGRAFAFTLEAGLPLLEAARRGFAAEGFAGGVLNFRRGALGPFAYVMPALSKTGENAAFYSDTFRPDGVTRPRLGSMTLGTRDGAPFFHCHGLWTEADGKTSGGHMLPDETVVAEPFEVEAFGLDGAIFTAEPDPETNFKLFGPVAAARTGAQTTSRAFALRLRPNQDFAGCLEEFCRAHGIARAKIHGGVGSTIGARFTHGGVTEPFATELAITAGTIAPSTSGALEVALDVALIDYTGGVAEGRLIRGDNPVLMTMELVLEVLG